jgi:hypothetical protein
MPLLLAATASVLLLLLVLGGLAGLGTKELQARRRRVVLAVAPREARVMRLGGLKLLDLLAVLLAALRMSDARLALLLLLLSPAGAGQAARALLLLLL